MAAEDNFVVDDGSVPTRDQDVKGLPDDDLSEEKIDETVSKDPELQKDLSEGIDKSNIIDETTRGAKPEGGYKEPDEDDLPEE